MVFWIVEAVAGFVENFIGFLFISDVLGVEDKKHKKGMILSLVLTIGLLLINKIQLFSVFAVLYGIIGITASVYFMYHGNMWDIFVAVVSYFLLLYLLEFLMISLAGTVLGRKDFGAYIVSQQSWTRVLFVTAVKVALILCYFLFHKLFCMITIASRRMLIGVLVAFELIFGLEKGFVRE